MSKKLKLTPETLLLSGDRIFFSIQGEGPTIGEPAIFLRLHLCNLHCGFCDTPYTWDKSLPEFLEEPERWKFREVYREMAEYHPCNRLVITGGEPLLQQEAIANFLLDYGFSWKIEIETNGTIMPSDYLKRRCQFNCSPKLANSGNPLKLRYKPEVLRALNNLYDHPDNNFKFVVISKKDVKEVDQIIKECNLDKDKIILMPEGVNMKAITKHSKEVVDLALQRGWRLLPRLQIMLFGDKRRT